MFNPSHKVKRDLLTKMSSIRNTDGGLVVQRNDTYDKLGRPVTRQTLRSGGAMNETFDYNDRSESARRLAGRLDKSAAFAPKGRTADGAAVSQLIHATRTVGDSFDYAYDNIGNRVTAQEVNSGATSDVAYVTNDLNQYTQIDTNGSDFTPGYDKDGNQTLIQTETGIWRVTYNVQNRAIKFESKDGHTVITCDYDYMGRRVFKKVEKDGVVTAHERYLYRNYLQIASLDMMEGQNQALINAYVWDPTQPVATRPLAIFYKGSAYYYGWDLTKNITEIFSLSARLQIDYVYTPFGQVRENGIIQQSIQWSSEYHDAETGLVYYNYRYYNPCDGRWTRRDCSEENNELNLYAVVRNVTTNRIDQLGLLGFQYTQFEIAMYEEKARLIKNTIAAIAKLIEGYEAMKEANIIDADKWFHCLYMCRSAREGNLPRFTLLLGLVREILEFVKGRFIPSIDSRTKKEIGAMEHLMDCLSDMEANGIGVDCPEELSCECCCAAYKVNGIERE